MITVTKDDAHFRKFYGARRETIKRLRDLYGKTYFEDAEAAQKRKKMQEGEFVRMQKYFNLSAGGNVLDIGCGTGDFLLRFPTNWKKFGIELSDFAREAAERNGVITDVQLEDSFLI